MPQDLQIEQHAGAREVNTIDRELAWEDNSAVGSLRIEGIEQRSLVVKLQLSQPCDPRDRPKNGAVNSGIFTHEARVLGPRTNKTHLSSQDVDDLR